MKLTSLIAGFVLFIAVIPGQTAEEFAPPEVTYESLARTGGSGRHNASSQRINRYSRR